MATGPYTAHELALGRALEARMADEWVATIGDDNGVRLSDSSAVNGVVAKSWESLLDEARQRSGDPSVTLTEYTLARVMASERSSAPPRELVTLGDADLNRFAAQSGYRYLHGFVTAGTGKFGSQGVGGRKVSSARDPHARHLRAAFALLRGPTVLGVRVPGLPGPARGYSRGATQYLDARDQYLAWKSGKKSACHPLRVLESWTYNKAKEFADAADRSLDAEGHVICNLGPARPTGQQEWVGPIEGVDAWRTMLFRPATSAQAEHYQLARTVIESNGATQPAPRPYSDNELAITAALALALVLIPRKAA